MTQIVLKDQDDADVVFTHVKTAANRLHFVSRGENLIDTRTLDLQLNDSRNTNRIKYKLTIPKVKTDPATGNIAVSFTHVVSGDFSVVKFSEDTDRALLQALSASLANSTAVADLVKNGAFPV